MFWSTCFYELVLYWKYQTCVNLSSTRVIKYNINITLLKVNDSTNAAVLTLHMKTLRHSCYHYRPYCHCCLKYRFIQPFLPKCYCHFRQTRRTETVCGGIRRETMIYTSSGNSVEIRIVRNKSNEKRGYFALRYERKSKLNKCAKCTF